MLPLILHLSWAFTDIAIPIFAYQVISCKSRVKLNSIIYGLLLVSILILYSFFPINYMYIQIPVYILLVINDYKKNFFSKHSFYCLCYFILLNIVLLPIINILYYYLFNGYLDVTISFFGIFTQQKLEFLIKMTLILILFYIRNNSVLNTTEVVFKKKYWNYSNLFLLICYILFIIFIIIAIDNEKLLSFLSLLSGLIISLFFIFNNVFQWLYENIVEKNRLLLEKEKTKIQLAGLLEQQKFVDEMRKFKHDIKNNFIIINHMIQKKEFDAATNYLENYIDSFQSINDYMEIDNIIISAIVNDKIRRYPLIEFDIRCFIPQKLHVNDLDLNTILGNLLDNACEYITKEYAKGKILVKISVFADTNLFIEISNPCKETEITKETLQTKKNSKNEHGYGILNVISVVDKYFGFYDNKIENGTFTAKILIPEGIALNDYIKED